MEFNDTSDILSDNGTLWAVEGSMLYCMFSYMFCYVCFSHVYNEKITDFWITVPYAPSY